MFQNHKISLQDAGTLNQLVQDYLDKKEKTIQLYQHYPDLDGFKTILSKNSYQNFDRTALFNVVQNQSHLTLNLSEKSQHNILSLKENHTYTVTTGHQLCLFTGPLYFIYKILSTINLSEALKLKFPNFHFVPVYWMASEDHDFAEINHIHLFGKKLEWQTEQKGAVGNFATSEIVNLINEVKTLLGQSESANQLVQMFEQAYLNHKNLADATRFLVNALFSEYGLVCIDGNDLAFKKQFTANLEKDIFQNTSFQTVNTTNDYLTKNGYTIQVNPREINCFLLEHNARNRIEKKDNQYNLVGTEKYFTQKELNQIINNTPDKISPNVVLRPLYQQFILPNIAYVGGPGELAYWLEYKTMFESYNIQFPILMPRNFLSIIDVNQKTKIAKLQLLPEDFFKTEKELIDTFQKNNNANFELLDDKDKLNQLYSEISSKLNLVDKSLLGTLQAELQKSIHGLAMVEAKANKALKQKSETEINQIKAIKQKLFPDNVPQERYDNFSAYVLKYGFNFIKEIKKNIDPFDFRHNLLIEN